MKILLKWMKERDAKSDLQSEWPIYAISIFSWVYKTLTAVGELSIRMLKFVVNISFMNGYKDHTQMLLKIGYTQAVKCPT